MSVVVLEFHCCNGEALASRYKAHVGRRPVRGGLPLYPTAKLLTDCEDVVTLFSARYSKISEKLYYNSI